MTARIKVEPESLEWMSQAACIGHDQDLWFATPASYEAGLARQVCRRCPVIAACRDYGTANVSRTVEGTGIWGGLSPKERRSLRRSRVERGAA